MTYRGNTVENKCGQSDVSPKKAEWKIASTGEIIVKAIITTDTDHTFQVDKLINLINYHLTLSIIFCAIGASSASFSTSNWSSLKLPQDLSSSLSSVKGLTGYS